MIAHLLRHGRKARNAEREVLRDFSYERKEDQTKILGECPPRNVLGSSRMAHPDHCSLAHCEADHVISRGARQTARYHAVRDITMSASPIGREHRSG